MNLDSRLPRRLLCRRWRCLVCLLQDISRCTLWSGGGAALLRAANSLLYFFTLQEKRQEKVNDE